MSLPPIDTTTGADVVNLPVKKAEPPTGERMLQPVPYIGRCKHWNVTFEVDEDSGDCKCLGCGERVTAIFVLKRLKERERTKCQHCGEMTRISHR